MKSSRIRAGRYRRRRRSRGACTGVLDAQMRCASRPTWMIPLFTSDSLVLLTDCLSIGLAVGIKELFAIFFPCGLHFRRSDIPIRPALLGDGTEVLTEIFG